MTAFPDPTPFNQFNWFVDPNMKDAYSLQWNFGVQHQLDTATVASATYVGSANRRLNYGDFYNTAKTPGPGDPALRRPYPYIAPTFYSLSKGQGNYNALQLQLTRSFYKGLGGNGSLHLVEVDRRGLLRILRLRRMQHSADLQHQGGTQRFGLRCAAQHRPHLELRIPDWTRQSTQCRKPGAGSRGRRMAVQRLCQVP